MIAPSSRLLRWTALIVPPFALLAAIRPETWPLSAAATAILFLLALLDLALSSHTLEGCTLEVPKLVRAAKDRPADLEVRIHNEQAKARLLRLGLALPPEFHSPQAELQAALPEGSTLSRVFWQCTPLQRGRFLLERTYLEGSSPLGFWAVRALAPVQSEIRVYPNLLSERKRVAAIFLHRGSYGVHAQRQVGKGRQFEGLRDYVPGDSSDDIHWKVTAKRGRPVTKVYQVERTQEVYVLIDAARLSARRTPADLPSATPRAGAVSAATSIPEAGSPPAPTVTILERYINSALILGLAAEQQGDLFGLVTFSDKVQKFVRARTGREHYHQCREALYTLQPQVVTPDFEELASFIRLRLRRRALLVFLTALDDPVLAESFVRSLDLLRRQHLLLVNMVQPAEARALFSTSNVASVDDLYRQLGGHLLWHDLRELGKVLDRRGVRLALLESENMTAALISQYLAVKQRQLL